MKLAIPTAAIALLALSACGEDTSTASTESPAETTVAQVEPVAEPAQPTAPVEAERKVEPEPADPVIAFRGEDGEMALARESLTMISPVHDADGDRWSVFVQLEEDAAEKFYDLTTHVSGEALVVVVDGMVVSAPVLDTPVYGGGFVFPVDDGEVASKVVAALTGRELAPPAPVTVDAGDAAPAGAEDGEAVAEAETGDE